jgi:dihydroorotase
MPGVLITNVEHLGTVGDFLISPHYATAMDQAVRTIDATGLVAVPGFRDLHVHFREPGFSEKEDILSGARAAAAGGYASVLMEPNTRPVIDSLELVQEQQQRVKAYCLPLDVRSKCALTKGQQGKALIEDFSQTARKLNCLGSELSSDGEPVANRWLLTEAFREAAGTTIHLHCEATPHSQAELAKVLGPGPAMGREPALVALAIEALADAKAGGQQVGQLHVQHVSLAESVRLIAGARAHGMQVTCEVAPHHLLLCDEDIPTRDGEPDANWKMNPPLRGRADMLAMRKAFADGTIDFIATDHAPHTPEEKSRRWDEAPNGVIGLETAFGACMTLVHAGEFTFERLIEGLCAQLKTISRMPNAHFMRMGVGPSLTLVDPTAAWTVDPDRFYSKSRNCPFAGMAFKGKPVYTIVGDQVVMADGEVLF